MVQNDLCVSCGWLVWPVWFRLVFDFRGCRWVLVSGNVRSRAAAVCARSAAISASSVSPVVGAVAGGLLFLCLFQFVVCCFQLFFRPFCAELP